MENSLYTKILESHLSSIEENLLHYLPSDDCAHQKVLFDAMTYACAAGGKRLRPVLVMEFCRICGGDPKMALPYACAIEMIHSYSLVHDDLPCMDNSLLRRGRPSTFATFGEDTALLAGDALLNRAFEIMLEPQNLKNIPSESIIKASFSLAKASGAFGMVGGQVIDLQSEGKSIDLSTLEQLQQGKTAALIIAACEMGCYLANASENQVNAAHEFGEQVGLCFQIVDDILDVTSTADELGKPVGSDADNHKATYVTLLGKDAAYALACERTQRAIDALQSFSHKADSLRTLATSLLQRKK